MTVLKVMRSVMLIDDSGGTASSDGEAPHAR